MFTVGNVWCVYSQRFHTLYVFVFRGVLVSVGACCNAARVGVPGASQLIHWAEEALIVVECADADVSNSA